MFFKGMIGITGRSLLLPNFHNLVFIFVPSHSRSCVTLTGITNVETLLHIPVV